MSRKSRAGSRRPAGPPTRPSGEAPPEEEKPARPRWATVLLKWLAGIVVAALAAALTAGLTSLFDALGRKAKDAVLPGSSSPAPTPSGAAADPVTVAVESLGVCGPRWVTPLSADAVRDSAPPDFDTAKDWPDWPPAAGGGHAGPHDVLFFVQGRSDAEVILTGLRVRVLERKALPATSTLLSAECAGPGAFRWLDVDLDQSPARPVPTFNAGYAETFRGDVPDKQLTPIRFPYEVSLSDAEPFLITARTQQCDCTWVAELSWASEGRTGTVTVDDRGKPFRTIGTTRTTRTCKLTSTGTTCD
jgi:hypothetical protein